MTPEEQEAEEFEFEVALRKRKQEREAAQADPSLQTAVLPPADKPSTLGQDVLSGAKDFALGAGGQLFNAAQNAFNNRPTAVARRAFNKTLGQYTGPMTAADELSPGMLERQVAFPKSTAGQAGASATQLGLGLVAPMNLGPQIATNAGIGMLGAEPGSELRSGAVGGIMGGAGSLGARVLARTAAGPVIPASDYADMVKQGIRPTLGMASARGGEKGTGVGDFVRSFEKNVQALPLSGMSLRNTVSRAGEDVTSAATKLGNIPGQPPPEFLNRQDLINKLRERNNAALNVSDEATVIPMTTARRQEAAKLTEDVANKYQLDAGEKQELLGFVRRGLIGHVPQGMPADLTGKAAKSAAADLRGNLPHNLKRERVQFAANDIAGMIEKWVDEASAAAGKPQKPLRTALADVHVMDKAPGTAIGMSGEDLSKGISANDESMKTVGSHSPEMLELAKASRGVTAIPNKTKYGDHYTGGAVSEAGLGVMSSGMLNLGADVYGRVAANPKFLRMMMNDPALQAKYLKYLRGGGSTTAVGTNAFINSLTQGDK